MMNAISRSNAVEVPAKWTVRARAKVATARRE